MIKCYLMMKTPTGTKTIAKVDSIKKGREIAIRRHLPKNCHFWIGEYRNGQLDKSYDIN